MNHLYKFLVLLGIFLVLGGSDLPGCVDPEEPVLRVRVASDTPESRHVVAGVSFIFGLNLEFEAIGGDIFLQALPVEVRFPLLNDGRGITRLRAMNEAGDFIAGPVNFSEENRAILAFGDEGFLVPDGQIAQLKLWVDVEPFPVSISGSTFFLSIEDSQSIIARGQDGEVVNVELEEKTMGNEFSIYRTVPWMQLNPYSPQGTSVPGAGQDVLRVDLFADIFGQHLEVNALAFRVRGNATLIGSGAVWLFESTDLADPLAVVHSKPVVAQDPFPGSGLEHSTTQVVAPQGAFNGIPVGSVVRIRSGMEEEYFPGTFVVEGVTPVDHVGNVAMKISPPLPRSIANGDRVFYRPLQPCDGCENGDGMLYFGAMTTLLADLSSGETEVWVADIRGFSVGDVLYPRGYSESGELLVRESGCEVTAFFEAVQRIGVTPCYLTGGQTIDANYVPIEEFHVSFPVVKKHREPFFFAGPGGRYTFQIVGDTTGAETEQVLQLNMEANGFHWSDGISFDVLQPEFNEEFPISGGVLMY